MKKFALLVIRAYQGIVSPYLGAACRYVPSCSEYTYQAVERFGLFKGAWMGLKRIARCQPFAEGGYDPCPPGGG